MKGAFWVTLAIAIVAVSAYEVSELGEVPSPPAGRPQPPPPRTGPGCRVGLHCGSSKQPDCSRAFGGVAGRDHKERAGGGHCCGDGEWLEQRGQRGQVAEGVMCVLSHLFL